MKNSLLILVLFVFTISTKVIASSSITDITLLFLNALDQKQKQLASFELEDDDRTNWNYVPASRKGISLQMLKKEQQPIAFSLLEASLSQSGFIKAKGIISLESVLRELEGSSYRDPELYYISIFGTPSKKGIWGWRFEGHHLSLNFTLNNDKLSSITPNFWGANPAIVPSGPQKGLRVLHFEQSIAKELIKSLNDKQFTKAQINQDAYSDILTKNKVVIQNQLPKGINYTELDAPQKKLLSKLINEYLNNMPADIASQRRKIISASNMEDISFAWAGKRSEGSRHYYRIQGETFLIEFDNYQNHANHIHAVWREYDGDFGRDLIKEHYEEHH